MEPLIVSLWRVISLCEVMIAFLCLSAGAVYTWGPNSFGELGFGDSGGPVAVPRRCLALEQHRVTHVACGGHHTLALTSTHAVYAWGQNNCGQVGCGSTSKEEAEPRQVSGELAERAVTGIACAMSSSFAVTTQGEVRRRCCRSGYCAIAESDAYCYTVIVMTAVRRYSNNQYLWSYLSRRVHMSVFTSQIHGLYNCRAWTI